MANRGYLYAMSSANPYTLVNRYPSSPELFPVARPTVIDVAGCNWRLPILWCAAFAQDELHRLNHRDELDDHESVSYIAVAPLASAYERALTDEAAFVSVLLPEMFGLTWGMTALECQEALRPPTWLYPRSYAPAKWLGGNSYGSDTWS